MKKTILIVLVVSVRLISVGLAEEGVWTQRADMPTPRWGHTSAVVNGKVYVIGGGSDETNFKYLSTVEEYDPATDTWTMKTDMPTARGWMSPSSSVVHGRIYVIGGDGGGGDWCLPTVEEYDPATDSWTRKDDMPTSRWALATCTLNGKIYAIGGYPPPMGSRGLTTVEVYDPVTDTWAKKADMPLAAGMLTASVVSGKIYAIGGRPLMRAQSHVQEYDPATDTWTKKTNMLVGTSQMASVVLDDKIVVIGGWLISSEFPYTTMQIYDPETDIWTREADLPFLRAVFSAEVIRGRIFGIGGTDRPHPCPATSTVYECDTGYIPIYLCDFNGDGMIDVQDICIVVDNWGTDNSLYDVGPMPWGDGIVDVEDLKVLAEHLFEDIKDPTLIAHWALDETEGITTQDSVNGNNDYIIGGAHWQPAGGVIDGALELDGVDDCIITTSAPDPAEGPFSVVAWIKGGSPGQVIISQAVRADWLRVDASTGTLMTELKNSDGFADPLLSKTVITDGQWHRIGLVWDGSQRMLYVDGLVVGTDIQDGLEASAGGICIGVGKNYAPGTFFSGLIDDVRIYNRAVSP